MTVGFLSRRRLMIVVVAVVFFCVLLAWMGVAILHGHKESGWARTYARILPLPAGRVGHQWVLYRDYLQHVDAQAVFLQGTAAKALGYPSSLTDELRKQSFDRAMRIATVDQLAQDSNLQITDLDVERSYQSLIEKAGPSSTHEEVVTLLRTQFGWDEEDFKTYVVRPALIEDALRQRAASTGQSVVTFDTTITARMTGADSKRFVRF